MAMRNVRWRGVVSIEGLEAFVGFAEAGTDAMECDEGECGSGSGTGRCVFEAGCDGGGNGI